MACDWRDLNRITIKNTIEYVEHWYIILVAIEDWNIVNTEDWIFLYIFYY